MPDKPKPTPTRRYYCAECGKDMGVWDSRYCEIGDTCGEPECERGARDSARSEIEEHEQLDRDLGYDPW